MTASPGPVASAVRAEIARRGRTHGQAAALLGISQTAFSVRARGKKDFTVREVLAIADWLDIPVSVLMEEPSVRARTDAPPASHAPRAQPIPA